MKTTTCVFSGEIRKKHLPNPPHPHLLATPYLDLWTVGLNLHSIQKSFSLSVYSNLGTEQKWTWWHLELDRFKMHVKSIKEKH